ncbi:transient receptor potential-gamma protein-like isoform X1 [Musca domestica]|uniref:Transient receptor potential-gamma protein-like isoform X1 n=1 Tax=Musca domestica TaxID=7370 RepID=A0ABM3V752_MUSDO|nr:transient receptor potential-gamma protein-like isoform X1 [Musca domestica]
MMEEENIIRPHQEIRQLTLEEKKFLLAVERGDMAGTRRMLQKAQDTDYININCVDPLGRTALLMAIDNENLEMVELLISYNVDTKDALLHSISEEFVEAVEVLLDHEHVTFTIEGNHSWESSPEETSTFTPDITPLILAAHRDNYEIIKILLDRGAVLPMPHDVRCGCDECVQSRQEDSLRHSRSRINAYRALASPSLIALSSKDPILTAFELSWELRRLSFLEHEFKNEYQELRKQCQDFATALLDHTRTSHELEILLNHDPTGPVYEHGERMHLNRLKLAIKLRQKKFVAHSNVQQLLASIWYEGLPGFRRKNMALQALDIIRIGMMFPIFSLAYILAPYSSVGQTMRKPFIKFICHSASYFTFLFLLMLASQRIETFIGGWFWSDSKNNMVHQVEELPTKRGAKPTFIEWLILAWVSGLIWSEVKQLWDVGLQEYLNDMWNVIDFVTNSLYVATVALRVVSFFQVQKEMITNPHATDLPRERWDAWDPMLISEGLFSAANIFSSLKLVYIFSVNPHLGPLQVSLSRMVMDIMKFFFLYVLVLFAFGSGLNQLLWYYADLEKKRCPEVSPTNVLLNMNGTTDPNACIVWRRFSNLFETTQTLFWAVFGLIDLDSFELDGIKIFTRFWGMLMFGTYSVINIVVLLNLLIAMMNHSYQLISERADVEWKFARSKLWISYFEEGGTCPPPFNIIPTPKSIWYAFKWARRVFCSGSSAARREHLKTIRRKAQQANDRDFKYQQIMRNLVRRYVTVEQRKAESQGVTEDDVNEIKQDISAFRCELVEILKNSGMDTNVSAGQGGGGGKKNRQKERRLMKGFNIAPPGSTGSLAPVAEFSTSLDNFEQQHDILSSTLSNLFTPNFMQKKATFCASDSFNSMESPPPSLISTVNTVQSANKYNKSTLKPYNKRIAGHKKKWGTLIEAAKVGNVSKMLGRSKSEDSVCNSSTTSSPVHGQVRVTYSQNGQSYYNSSNSNESTTGPSYNIPAPMAGMPTPTIRKDHLKPLNVNGPTTLGGLTAALNGGNGSAGGSHFFHTPTGLTAIAALKKKRKKFSSSKNICPVTESISTSNAADLLNDKALKRVSSYPASDGTAQSKDAANVAKPRRHEQTQSQHDSVETSTEFTLASEKQHLDPSNTSVNSREPLISGSSGASTGVIH